MRDAVELRERLAVAINTSNLSPEGSATQMIGALGAATLARRFDAEIGRPVVRVTAVGTAVISPQGRLGSLLERAKFGRDRKAEHQAAILFAHQLATKRSWVVRLKLRRAQPLLLAIAGIVVAEWVHDRCPQCGGAGTVPLERRGARNVRTVLCRVCDGLGLRMMDHVGRAGILGVPIEAYHAHWRLRLDEATGWLREIEANIIERLRLQNQRGNVRAVSECLRS